VKQVLVTGAAGFIGSALVRRLLAGLPGVQVVSLDRVAGAAGSLDNLVGVGPDRHCLVRGDVCDRDLVDHLLRAHDIDTVIHCAAETHVDRSIDGPGAFVRTNVQGTWTVLEAARRRWLGRGQDATACRFHQVSTDEVFGDRQDRIDPASGSQLAVESSAFRPSSPYAASKAAADHLVLSYHHTYGLPVSITFSCNNLGPRQYPEKLIPFMLLRALSGQPLPLYGDGLARRRWLHVDDHCDAIMAVIQADVSGQSFAVGPQACVTNLDLIERLCVILDRRRPLAAPGVASHADAICLVADRPGHDRLYSSSPAKLRDRLAWSPALDLDSALDATVAWYLAHPAWLRRATAGPQWAGWLDRWYGAALV